TTDFASENNLSVKKIFSLRATVRVNVPRAKRVERDRYFSPRTASASILTTTAAVSYTSALVTLTPPSLPTAPTKVVGERDGAVTGVGVAGARQRRRTARDTHGGGAPRIDPAGTRTRRLQIQPTATTTGGAQRRRRRPRRRVPTSERLPASAQQVSSVLLCPLNRTQRPLLGADRGCALFFFHFHLPLFLSSFCPRPPPPSPARRHDREEVETVRPFRDVTQSPAWAYYYSHGRLRRRRWQRKRWRRRHRRLWTTQVKGCAVMVAEFCGGSYGGGGLGG
ncbi:Uncharacterized protein FWK35_00036964, partial [Aphis craccivora]